MPELPEVETVRRGLAPVMEGARFTQGRGAPRRPALAAAEGFRRRGSKARPSSGLGRRAKYLLADLSSGEVLLMHLGMSGSFRVLHGERREQTPGDYPPRARASISAHDHVVFHMSNGAIVTFNDPRRFGSMKLVAARRARPGAADARARPRAARQRVRRRHAGARLHGQEDLAQGRAVATRRSSPGSATSMSARRCIARGFRPSGAASTIATRSGAPQRARASGWSTPSRRCSTTRSRPAARRCATTAAPTASSAISSTISASTTAKASLPDAGLQGHHQAHRADRTLDVLLPGVPEVIERGLTAFTLPVGKS